MRVRWRCRALRVSAARYVAVYDFGVLALMGQGTICWARKKWLSKLVCEKRNLMGRRSVMILKVAT
jgi:hypothetical protein